MKYKCFICETKKEFADLGELNRTEWGSMYIMPPFDKTVVWCSDKCRARILSSFQIAGIHPDTDLT